MIKLINTEAEKLPENATAMFLSKQLLEKVMELEQEPTRAAIDYLKGEISIMI
jgi:hypothetical protein